MIRQYAHIVSILVVIVASGCTQLSEKADWTDSNRLAAKYQNKGNFKLAERYHREALDKMRGDPSVSPDWIAIQLSNLASAINQRGRADEARILLLEAREIIEKVPEADFEDLGIILGNLAESEELLGNFDQAETLYIESELILESVPNIEPAFTGSNVAGLARILARRNDIKGARDYHAAAKQMYTNSFGSNSIQWQRKTAKFEAILKAKQALDNPGQQTSVNFSLGGSTTGYFGDAAHFVILDDETIWHLDEERIKQYVSYLLSYKGIPETQNEDQADYLIFVNYVDKEQSIDEQRLVLTGVSKRVYESLGEHRAAWVAWSKHFGEPPNTAQMLPMHALAIREFVGDKPYQVSASYKINSPYVFKLIDIVEPNNHTVEPRQHEK